MAEHATSPCPLPLPVLLLLLLLLMLTLMASAQPTYAAVDTSTAARASCCCRGTVESPKTYLPQGGRAGAQVFTEVNLPPSRYLVTARLLSAFRSASNPTPRAACPSSVEPAHRPLLGRASHEVTAARPDRSPAGWVKPGSSPAPGSPARLTPLFRPRGGACSMHAPLPSAALAPDAAPPPFTCSRSPQDP